MKLKTITEAYDKNLAEKVARKYEITPARVKEIVTSIDPELTYGPWVLKQLATNDINVTTTKRLQKIIKKFHAVKEQLADKNINSYTDLARLEQTLEQFQEPEKESIHPIEEAGLMFVKKYEQEPDITYHAYAFFAPNKLMKYAKGTSWCVQKQDQATRYLNSSPQVMIFKNESPTTLFSLDLTEKKNSGNVDESRPEILEIIDDITRNEKSRITAESENNLTTWNKLVALAKRDPQNATPDKLSEDFKKELLQDPQRAISEYVSVIATKMPFPSWPQFEALIYRLQHRVDEYDYNGPASSLVIRYHTYSAEEDSRSLQQYFKGIFNFDPPSALQSMLDYKSFRSNYMQSMKAQNGRVSAREMKGHKEPGIDSLIAECITEYFLKSKNDLTKMHDDLTHAEFRRYTNTLSQAMHFSNSYKEVPGLVEYILKQDVPVDIENATVSRAIKTARDTIPTKVKFTHIPMKTSSGREMSRYLIDIVNEFEKKHIEAFVVEEMWKSLIVTDENGQQKSYSPGTAAFGNNIDYISEFFEQVMEGDQAEKFAQMKPAEDGSITANLIVKDNVYQLIG